MEIRQTQWLSCNIDIIKDQLDANQINTDAETECKNKEQPSRNVLRRPRYFL